MTLKIVLPLWSPVPRCLSGRESAHLEGLFNNRRGLSWKSGPCSGVFFGPPFFLQQTEGIFPSSFFTSSPTVLGTLFQLGESWHGSFLRNFSGFRCRLALLGVPPLAGLSLYPPCALTGNVSFFSALSPAALFLHLGASTGPNFLTSERVSWAVLVNADCRFTPPPRFILFSWWIFPFIRRVLSLIRNLPFFTLLYTPYLLFRLAGFT